jgi:hypothetical protein
MIKRRIETSDPFSPNLSSIVVYFFDISLGARLSVFDIEDVLFFLMAISKSGVILSLFAFRLGVEVSSLFTDGLLRLPESREGISALPIISPCIMAFFFLYE